MEKIKVKIRSWKSMEKEFGLNEWGNILTKYAFVDEMKFMCDKKKIELDEDFYTTGGWYISSDMVKKKYRHLFTKDK